MNRHQAQVFVGQVLAAAKREFFDNKDPTMGDSGYAISQHVEVDENGGVNGNLFPHGENGVCVLVGGPVLDLGDVAAKFVLAHELGHAFVYKVCIKLEFNPQEDATGKKEELFPDALAAYLLNGLGVSYQTLIQTLQSEIGALVFDADDSGNHPSHEERLECLRTFASGMTTFNRFADALRVAFLTVE